MRGKKPLSKKQVVALRKLVEGNELHELLLNLGVDLMLRASDLLNLKVSDVLNESGSVKKEVRVRMKKTKKTFPFMIVPKASKSEKNEGLDNFDTKQVTGGGGGVGDYIDDVNSASGKFGSEKAPSRNIHPTVKPLTLMNYLVVLGSRKGDVVLEPFAGSGTTALACVSQERDYIAIEREEEYYDIAKARLEKVEQPLKMWEKFS